MSIFDLRANPFFILEISLRESKQSTAERAEALLADGKLSDDDALKVQRELFASKPRLANELGWLPEVAPKRASEIRKTLLSGGVASAEERTALVDSIEGLSCINVAAHFLSLGDGSAEILEHMIDEWRELSLTTIKDLINENRRISGFPEVNDLLMGEAASDLRDIHSQAALSWLTLLAHPGKSLAESVQRSLRKYGKAPEILEQIVEKYDTWVISKVKAFETKITERFQLMKDDPNPDRNKERVHEIIALLRDWDEYSQPSQLLYQSKGLDEPRSRRIFEEVRHIGLWLANEQSAYSVSLEFSRALLDIFPELPVASGILKDDVNTLTELLDRSKATEELSPLLQFLETVLKNEKPFTTSLERGEFGKDKEGLGGQFYKTVVAVRDKVQGKPYASEMWTLLRNLALFLHNEKNSALAAFNVASTLLILDPPDDIRSQLGVDIGMLTRNLLSQQCTAAISAKAFGKARKLAKMLAETATDEKERKELEEVHATLEQRRGEQVTKRVIYIGLIVCGVVIFINENKGTTNHRSSTHAGAASPSQAGRNVPGIEKKPLPGTEVLDITELRWCTFEKERITIVGNQFPKERNELNPVRRWNGSLLQQKVLDAYNTRIDEYNLRCMNTKYFERDMITVTAELLGARDKHVHEAKQLMNTWDLRFRFNE